MLIASVNPRLLGGGLCIPRGTQKHTGREDGPKRIDTTLLPGKPCLCWRKGQSYATYRYRAVALQLIRHYLATLL